jgi:hypothetical protein
MRRSTFMKFALPTMLALALAAAWAGPAVAQAGKVIKMIPGGDLKIIDPIQNASYISRNHGYMVYDTLFSVDSKGQVKPQMVDTFTLSPDNKKYTFTLRQGLKWHDGAPVTAADCVASIRRWGAKDVSGTLLMHWHRWTWSTNARAGVVQRALHDARAHRQDRPQPGSPTPPAPPFIFKKDEWVGHAADSRRTPTSMQPLAAQPNWHQVLRRWPNVVEGQQLLKEAGDRERAQGRRQLEAHTLTLKEPFGLVIDALGKPSSNVPFMMPERIAKTDPNQQITDATGSGPWIDRSLMALAVTAFSLPVFLIGYLLIFGFSIQLGWLPVQGFRSLSEGFVPFIRHLILPAVSGGLVYMALIARMTRATMLEVLGEDYIRTARARGVGNRRLLLRHALKNAAVPIVTTIGLGIALLLGGVIITESVFAIPGIGRLTVDSVLRHDYPVIQGIVLVVAAVYVLINLAIDLLYTVLDPRIRY